MGCPGEGEGEGCMSSLRPAVTLGESLGAVSGRGCLRPPLNVPRCLAPPFLVRVRGLLAQVASCVGWMRRVPSPWYVLLACLTSMNRQLRRRHCPAHEQL